MRRSLEREPCEFFAKGNKFLHTADYEKAQRILDRQLKMRWEPMLNGFLPAVFPAMKEILGPHHSYYWTLWQSEWATDLLFPSARDLNALTESLMRHVFMTKTSTRVLRYLDRPITKAGTPCASMSNEISNRQLDFNDGARIRHWVDGNNVKACNKTKKNRVEMTMNQSRMFKVHRRAQGKSSSASTCFFMIVFFE